MWGLKCGHRIAINEPKPVVHASSSNSPIGTRNPFLIKFIRPKATDGGPIGDASLTVLKVRDERTKHAIVDMRSNGDAPKEEISEKGTATRREVGRAHGRTA